MDKLGKISSQVSKKLQGKKTPTHNNSGGQGLRELVKDATAKTLNRPDPDLNQQVVDLIGSAIHTEGPQEVARILTERLTLKNPHKVWLAISLIKEVLRKCETELVSVRDEIMFEVGKVASGAMNRFNSNLADQQRAKSAAFDLLKTYGQDGHILSQPHLEHDKRLGTETQAPNTRHHTTPSAGNERSGGRQYHSWPELSEAVQTQIAVAISHNDLLQDMLLDTSSFESRTPEQRALAKDVILEATQFRQSFEALLGQLSAYDSEESNTLMTTALEKMDILNNSLNLHKDSLRKQLSQQQQKTPRAGGANSGGRSHSSSPAKASTPKAPEPSLGGLMELQQGFDVANQPQPPAAHDPFAASVQWSQPPHPGPPQHQQHQQQRPPGGFPQQRPPGQHPPPAGGQNPFGQPAWGGGPPGSMPGTYPGYGYGGYHPSYAPMNPYGQTPPGPPNYSQPPQSQGYGQQPQWYPQAEPGYGYGPYSYPPQPHHFPQNSEHPGPRQHPPTPQPHVPPPITHATVTLPEHKPSAAPAPRNGPGKAANEAQRQPGASPLGPSTPPAAPAPAPAEDRQLSAPNAATQPGVYDPRGPPANPFGSSSFTAGKQTGVADPSPDANASAFLAGFTDPAPKGVAHASRQDSNGPPADEWDLFFTERVKGPPSGSREGEGSSRRPTAGVDGVTDAFGHLTTSRTGAA